MSAGVRRPSRELVGFGRSLRLAPPPFRRVQRLFAGMRLEPLGEAMLVGLVLLGALGLALSTAWGVRNDVPVLMYPARVALSQGRVPYLEIFDMNQPFAYLFYGVLELSFGPNDVALRWVDIALALFIAWGARDLLRVPSRLVGVAAGAVFAFWHIHDAGVDALEREVLVVALMVASGMALAKRHAVLAGAAIGCALMVKLPAAILFAPIVLVHLPRAGRGRYVARVAGGVALVLAVFVVALALMGALESWWWILVRYLPLYAEQAGTRTFLVSPDARWARRVAIFLDQRENPLLYFWPIPLWLAVRVRGGTFVSTPARAAALGFALAWLYPFSAGVFWAYHFAPAYLYAGGVAALVFALPSSMTRAFRVELGAAKLATLIALVHLLGPIYDDLPHQLEQTGRNGYAPELAHFLRENLEPGETVQPFDEVVGATDAMWRARAPLATSFIYDFHFYHHPRDPRIRALRQRLLDELHVSAPRYLLRARPEARLYVVGGNSSFPELTQIAMQQRQTLSDETFHEIQVRALTGELFRAAFPELEDFIDEHYQRVAQIRAVDVYERRP